MNFSLKYCISFFIPWTFHKVDKKYIGMSENFYCSGKKVSEIERFFK